MRSKVFIVWLLAVFALCVLAHFYIRHPVAWQPKQHHRLELWAGVGSAFTAIGTLFSGLCFVALIWTIRVQIETNKDATRKALILASSQCLGEIISDPK